MSLKKNNVKSFSSFIGENLMEDNYQNLIKRLDEKMDAYLETLPSGYSLISHLVTYIPPCRDRGEGLHYQLVMKFC